jgi:hypothetical protein
MRRPSICLMFVTALTHKLSSSWESPIEQRTKSLSFTERKRRESIIRRI